MDIKSARTIPIGELLEDYIENRGFSKKFHELSMAEIWPQVVGEKVASMTGKVNCRNGVLYVECVSRILRNEIMLKAEGIMGALNKAAGCKVVHKIIIL